MVQGIIDELWVVAQLLQIGDSRQDSHRLLSGHQLACRLGLEEVVVQIPLEVCQLTANYFNDLGAQQRGDLSRIKEHRRTTICMLRSLAVTAQTDTFRALNRNKAWA